MSFRLKTIIGVALIEAVLLIILVITSLSLLRTSNEEELGKRAHTAVELFASTTKDAVLSTDLASLEAFVQETLKNPDLLYARVSSATEGMLAEGGDRELLARPFAADASVAQVTDGVFDTVAPIVVGGTEYGRVEIGMSIERVAYVLEQARGEMVGLALIEMLLVALFSLVLGVYLTRQLKDLESAAQDIADGDLGRRVVIRSRDEVGAVASAFNSMSEQLAKADAARTQYERRLEELNEELEARVERRTARLLAANRALERTNAELQSTQAQLVQSEKLASIGQLAAGVAHEINNPMSFVRSNMETLSSYTSELLGLAELCERQVLDDQEIARKLAALELDFLREDLAELLTDTRDGIERVVSIVRDLGEFARVDHSPWEIVPVAELIHRALSSTSAASEQDVEVECHLDGALTVECMGAQLEQLIVSLIENALQAVGETGRVTVRARGDHESVWVEVADDGCGIEEENLKKVFDPFFTTKPVGQGTGLGLSIAFGTAKSHGGEITATSTVGVGSVFILRIPARQARRLPESDTEAISTVEPIDEAGANGPDTLTDGLDPRSVDAA